MPKYDEIFGSGFSPKKNFIKLRLNNISVLSFPESASRPAQATGLVDDMHRGMLAKLPTLVKKSAEALCLGITLNAGLINEEAGKLSDVLPSSIKRMLKEAKVVYEGIGLEQRHNYYVGEVGYFPFNRLVYCPHVACTHSHSF